MLMDCFIFENQDSNKTIDIFNLILDLPLINIFQNIQKFDYFNNFNDIIHISNVFYYKRKNLSLVYKFCLESIIVVILKILTNLNIKIYKLYGIIVIANLLLNKLKKKVWIL